MTLLEQLQQFIDSADEWHHNRQWLEDEHMKVYVRRGRRILPSFDASATALAVFHTRNLESTKRATTLELASIDVLENEQGQGRFKAFLAEAERINPWDALYIENVLTQRFESFFVRSGFLPVSDTFPTCFYKWRCDV